MPLSLGDVCSSIIVASMYPSTNSASLEGTTLQAAELRAGCCGLSGSMGLDAGIEQVLREGSGIMVVTQ